MNVLFVYLAAFMFVGTMYLMLRNVIAGRHGEPL
jgi:ABC-type anion transport system duplicated permease subunit